MKIVFCCTGNTCRSPIAEYLLRNYVDKHGIEGVDISSFGVQCNNGISISNDALNVLSDIGIDASAHLSAVITLREIIDADYVFAMTSKHVEWLRSEMNAGENVMTLGKFVGMGDVIDPYMCDTNQYRECRDIITVMIDKLAVKLQASNRNFN